MEVNRPFSFYFFPSCIKISSPKCFTKAWTNKAKGELASDGAEAKKRKREICEAENQEEAAKENLDLSKKQKALDLSANQKLSAFVFKQE